MHARNSKDRHGDMNTEGGLARCAQGPSKPTSLTSLAMTNSACSMQLSKSSGCMAVPGDSRAAAPSPPAESALPSSLPCRDEDSEHNVWSNHTSHTIMVHQNNEYLSGSGAEHLAGCFLT